MSIDVVILAAGQGTRMKSNKPKVIHTIANKPMVQHVIDAVMPLGNSDIHVVVGHGADQVKQAITTEGVNWVAQTEQLGTGHAVKMALPNIKDDSVTLILYGDVPLIKTQTLNALLDAAKQGHLGLLTVTLDDATGYGRIVRDSNNNVTAIVEHKDASADQLSIKEINTGILSVPSKQLKAWLPTLSNDNAQQEYYLTDIIGFAARDGIAITTAQPEHSEEVQGVNNRMQLAELERYHQQQIANDLLTAGVHLYDPARFDCRGTLTTGKDVVIDVNCIFEGDVVLGDNVHIGANCVIKNAVIEAGVEIAAFTSIEDSKVAANCIIGPYARLRPGTEMKQGAKVGNFVETKKSVIGEGSKVNHLSYIGDAMIGKQVNVGAGTITCNYDGVNKHKTVLKDGVFVGSNSSIVAPVTVEENSTIGAGSTITADIPQETLGVGRGRQKNIEGWKRPEKKA